MIQIQNFIVKNAIRISNVLNGSDVTLKHIDDLKFNGPENESITLDQKEEISEWLVKS